MIQRLVVARVAYSYAKGVSLNVRFIEYKSTVPDYSEETGSLGLNMESRGVRDVQLAAARAQRFSGIGHRSVCRHRVLFVCANLSILFYMGMLF